MNLSRLIAARPVIVFIVLTFLVLLLPCLLTPWWYKTAKHMEQKVDMISSNLRSATLSEVETTARLLHPLSSSARNLATVINSSLGSNNLSFSDIKTRVAPLLFLAFSTIPHTSQISYIGLDGLFFSYYIENSQTLAVYCNFSSAPEPSDNKGKQTWYTQPVDSNTGKLYGEAIATKALNINYTMLQEILNSSSNGFASKGSGWNEARHSLFINTANINGRAAVSLGFPVEAITNFFTGVNLYGASLSMTTNDGDTLVEGLPNAHMNVANNSISFQSKKMVDGNQQTSDTPYVLCSFSADLYHILKIGETEYNVHCSPLELAGVKSVYALAVPRQGMASFVHRTSKLALTLLILMIVSVVISVFSFVYLMVRSAKREAHLCAALIKHMEATQQAERKNMNKSQAYASASHDVRAYLAALSGLIEICFYEVVRGSELEHSLRQMEDNVKFLMDLLNTILDISKIDAGKMQLIEEEFDLSQLLENVVDVYHPTSMKKEVDVVLDPCDGSVFKYSHVKGDKTKLKQVLGNLLNNAVKFTSEGHISIRAWVQKPSLENSIIASNRNGFLQHLSCLFYKKKKEQNDSEAVNSIKNNPNCMEFIFEVDDTGKGIPKEKQQSVFENYVQVKEGQGGTGLGLGIVQSLVRLMGGDIKIMDKAIGEKGTCFRFNVFLTVDEAHSVDNTRADVDLAGNSTSNGTSQPKVLTFGAPSPGLTIRMPSPRLTSLLSPKPESSLVVLLIANEERRRVTHRYMEHLGLTVLVINRWESLQSILRKMKNKLISHSPHSSLGKLSDDDSGASLKDVPLSALEGTDQRVPSYRRRGGGPAFVLLVIDATAGPFSELLMVVTKFRRDLLCRCKVVWLDRPTSRCINFSDPEEEEMMDPSDDIISKPLHGSRLSQVMKNLPEFGGTYSPSVSVRPRRETGSSSSHTKHSRRGQEEDSSGSGKYSTHIKRESPDSRQVASPVQSEGRLSSRRYKTTETEIEEVADNRIDEKPFTGKRFLVAEDNPVLSKLAKINLNRLGATVQLCQNGEEALQLVRNGLNQQMKHGGPQILPYDYILMDCEMPIMDGFEATRQIRKEEKYYGVQIPIIALTAHVSGEQVNNTILAGMDVHLGKPLNKENLLEAIRYIDSKYKDV